VGVSAIVWRILGEALAKREKKGAYLGFLLADDEGGAVDVACGAGTRRLRSRT
jgi:hypothetical protein